VEVIFEPCSFATIKLRCVAPFQFLFSFRLFIPGFSNCFNCGIQLLAFTLTGLLFSLLVSNSHCKHITSSTTSSELPQCFIIGFIVLSISYSKYSLFNSLYCAAVKAFSIPDVPTF